MIVYVWYPVLTSVCITCDHLTFLLRRRLDVLQRNFLHQLLKLVQLGLERPDRVRPLRALRFRSRHCAARVHSRLPVTQILSTPHTLDIYFFYSNLRVWGHILYNKSWTTHYSKILKASHTTFQCLNIPRKNAIYSG